MLQQEAELDAKGVDLHDRVCAAFGVKGLGTSGLILNTARVRAAVQVLGNERVVAITAGMLSALRVVCRAVFACLSYPRTNLHLAPDTVHVDMIGILSREVEEVGAAGLLSDGLAPIVGPDKRMFEEVAPRVYDLALEFLVLHELAHVELGHDPASPNVANEHKADVHALRWLARSEGDPRYVAVAYVLAMEVFLLSESMLGPGKEHPVVDERLKVLDDTVKSEMGASVLSLSHEFSRVYSLLIMERNRRPLGEFSPWIILANRVMEHPVVADRPLVFRERARVWIAVGNLGRAARRLAIYLATRDARMQHADPAEREFANDLSMWIRSFLDWAADQGDAGRKFVQYATDEEVRLREVGVDG